MHNVPDHTHAHAHAAGIEEATAVLNYMHDHNAHHAEELHELSHDLEHFGKAEAAELIHECVKELENANEKLAAALDNLKGE